MFKGEHEELNKICRNVYDLTKKKSDFVNALKSHSSVVAFYHVESAYLEGFKSCLNRYNEEIDIWTIMTWDPSCINVYFDNPAFMHQFLHERLVKISNPKKLPNKVLAKMIRIRLDKALKLADHYNLRGSIRLTVGSQPVRIIDLETTDKKQDLQQWIHDVKQNFPYDSEFTQLEAFLMRNDVDDEITQEACRNAVIKEVADQ